MAAGDFLRDVRSAPPPLIVNCRATTTGLENGKLMVNCYRVENGRRTVAQDIADNIINSNASSCKKVKIEQFGSTNQVEIQWVTITSSTMLPRHRADSMLLISLQPINGSIKEVAERIVWKQVVDSSQGGRGSIGDGCRGQGDTGIDGCIRI